MDSINGNNNLKKFKIRLPLQVEKQTEIVFPVKFLNFKIKDKTKTITNSYKWLVEKELESETMPLDGTIFEIKILNSTKTKSVKFNKYEDKSLVFYLGTLRVILEEHTKEKLKEKLKENGWNIIREDDNKMNDFEKINFLPESECFLKYKWNGIN
jgi:hypothetical protein